MDGLGQETALGRAERRACDLSDEVNGLASLCRMVAYLGDGTDRSINERDFVSAMNLVSANMYRFRNEVEQMVSLLGDANDQMKRLEKTIAETRMTNI